MRGICFHGIEDVRLNSLVEPVISDPTDAIVRVSTAGVCGSDFHPYFGREVGIDVGTAMGHEFVGEVVETGRSVSMRKGTRVCAPFTTNCGKCFFCERGLTSRCESGQLFGWRANGEGLHGGQAEFVRVPLADATLVEVPRDVGDEIALLVGDNLSTGRFCAELAGVGPDRVCAVVGCGTVGLLAAVSARQMGTTEIVAIDPVESRRETARMLGFMTCHPDGAGKAMRELNASRGADCVMELVGLPDAQRLAYNLVRPGGTMAVIGCHCTPGFSFSPSDAYEKNLTYRTGRCPARHLMPRVFDELANSPLDLSWCVTHRFPPAEGPRAYDVMANQKDGCIKAVIDFD